MGDPQEMHDEDYDDPRKSKMNFSEALDCLKVHVKVARQGWNGKGMYIELVGSHQWYRTTGEEGLTNSSFIAMKTAQNTYIPWLASQMDMLAEDWCVVE